MQQAYLLHSRAYRETSQLLDFLTYDSGRIQLIGKGLKTSKKKNPIQLFAPYHIEFKGRGELKILTQHEVVRGRMLSETQGLQGKSLYCGFYINELLTRLLPKEQVITDVFMLYQNIIAQLMVSDDMESIQTALRQFEFQLLDTLGYGYDYEYDINNDAIDASASYQFLPEQGFFRVLEGCKTQQSAMIFSGSEIQAFKTKVFLLDQQATAKRFIRLAMAKYLGDKPLKSRELFKAF